VQQRGQHRGRWIERVLAGEAPPGEPGQAERALGVDIERTSEAGAVLDDVPGVDGCRAALVPQQVAEPGQVLDAVTVGVDHGMVEPIPDLGRGQ